MFAHTQFMLTVYYLEGTEFCKGDQQPATTNEDKARPREELNSPGTATTVVGAKSGAQMHCCACIIEGQAVAHNPTSSSNSCCFSYGTNCSKPSVINKTMRQNDKYTL